MKTVLVYLLFVPSLWSCGPADVPKDDFTFTGGGGGIRFCPQPEPLCPVTSGCPCLPTITLTSGLSGNVGYDFITNAYRGVTGGDFYYYAGAFWANNYDQRGVANLGACASVNSITTVPNVAKSRGDVSAVVGDCYLSPLHNNNRQAVIFRVQSQSGQNVTLSWALLPVPLDQLEWQHCEAYNSPSVSPTTTASTLTNWLAANSYVANAMQWILPSGTTVGYASWPVAMQNLLAQNFVAYWAWYANGMQGADPTPVTDPPENLYATNGGNIATILSATDAEALYVKYMAVSLVVELQHRVAWSLTQFDSASLAELVDSRKFFIGYSSGGYALLPLSVTPAPPLMAASYVAQNHFLCDTKVESIAEAVFWARNLQHYNNTSDPAQDQNNFWQYPGNAPVSRILNGTHYTGTDATVPTNLTQWTAGCHGTTGLLKSLLRTINIPVEHFSGFNPNVTEPQNAFYGSGHATPHFLSEGMWLSHGDDPYIGIDWEWGLPFPLTSLLVPDSTFYGWFPNNGPSSNLEYLGLQPYELWLRYGDQNMLLNRLTDLTTNPSPSDKNICSEIGESTTPPYESCAQAEAGGLLTMLDGLLAPYVASGSIDPDSESIPLYWRAPSQFLAAPCNTCTATVCAENSQCCVEWSGACESAGYRACNNACIY